MFCLFDEFFVLSVECIVFIVVKTGFWGKQAALSACFNTQRHRASFEKSEVYCVLIKCLIACAFELKPLLFSFSTKLTKSATPLSM